MSQKVVGERVGTRINVLLTEEPASGKGNQFYTRMLGACFY